MDEFICRAEIEMQTLVAEGEGGMNWETSIEAYTLLYVC